MTHGLAAAVLFSISTSALYIVLGAWVLTLEPRRRQTTLLALFTITFGLAFLIARLDVVLHAVPPRLPAFLANVVGGLNGALAVWLAWSTPEDLEDRRLLALALGLGLAIVALVAIDSFGLMQATSVLPFVSAAGFTVGFGGLGAASILLALRARPSRHPSPQDVTQCALLGVAFAIVIAFLSGVGIRDLIDATLTDAPATAALGAFAMADWLVIAGLWFWNMLQAGPRTVRVHRAAGLLTLGLLVAGAAYFVAVPSAEPTSTVMRGVMRTLGVALLAYGILRHDLAGLDEKVEYGLSKTTVAGIFVAVFFIVSEGAQVLFADIAGNNEWIGVLAAGALVFAISPLQRFADSFAAKAVPGGAEVGAAAEERYRRELEMALADGDVSGEEEHQLGRRAAELGIGTDRARELRAQVEADLGAEGGP